MQTTKPQTRKRKLMNSDDTISEPPCKRQKQNNEDCHHLISKLQDIFSNFQQPCNVTVGGHCKSLPLLPGLYINGIGDISLPISDEHIKQFKLLLSHKSNHKSFHFENPEWNKQINKLITNIAIKLGCNHNSVQYVEGYCDKLLIYQSNINGGQFIQHTDKEELEGIFATLMIQLPSRYTVIDNKPILMVKHKDNEYNYHFDCKYNIYYAAYYVDIIHEINKIKNGVGIVVTYNLCWNGEQNMMPKISNIEKMTHDIDDIFSHLTSSYPQPIAIKLNHLYSTKELSRNGINALKGRDFATIDNLRQYGSVKQQNFHIFLAQITNTKVRSDGLEGQQISDHGISVNNSWYSVNGRKFEFGKYIKMNLEKYCIRNDKDDKWIKTNESETQNYNLTIQTKTTYSKYIAILFINEYPFGFDGCIEWIKYLLSMNRKHNISSNIKQIINISGSNSYRFNKEQISNILSMLLETNDFDLISYFIDEFLIPQNINFHHRRIGKCVIDKISDILTKSGWNEPIKISVLNLIDCMNNNNYNVNTIKQYISLLKSMKNKNYNHYKFEEIYNLIDQSVFAQKLNIAHSINKEIAEYALDVSFEEISSKLWQNIVKKLNLNENGRGMTRLDDSNIVSILKLILSFKTDKQNQALMLESFNKTYDVNIAPYTQHNVLKSWIIYVNTLNGDDITPQIDVLINKFSSKNVKNHQLIPFIFKILMKTNKLESIIYFINHKLIAFHIGLHKNNYNQNIFDFVFKYGWNNRVKSIIFKLLDCMINTHCHLTEIGNYCLLPKLIKNSVENKNDDIIMLNSSNNDDAENMSVKYLNLCWKEIANKVWENMIIKLDFNGDGIKMSQLYANNIVCILELIILFDMEWDNEYKQKIYEKFDNIYSKNVNDKIQSQIILSIKSWENKSLYSHKCIQIIFRERIRYLRTVKMPNISWKIEINGYTNDYELKAFLQSTNKTFVKEGFYGIAGARSWIQSSGANMYYGLIQCQATGRGSKSIVKITKISNNKKIQQYNIDMSDLKLLLSFINHES